MLIYQPMRLLIHLRVWLAKALVYILPLRGHGGEGFMTLSYKTLNSFFAFPSSFLMEHCGDSRSTEGKINLLRRIIIQFLINIKNQFSFKLFLLAQRLYLLYRPVEQGTLPGLFYKHLWSGLFLKQLPKLKLNSIILQIHEHASYIYWAWLRKTRKNQTGQQQE